MPLKERLRAKSPRSSLSPFFQILIVIHVGYHIASCMKGNFTNTLLFRETESQNTIMLYNIFLFFSECVGMTVAAPLARRRGCIFCMRLGLAVHMFMQAAFFILLERITSVMPLMALLNGLSVGYYWMAYYTDVSEFSQDENRDRAIGVMGVCTSAVTLVMPAVCGAVISAMPGYAGYRLMFALCAVVSFAALLFSSRLAGHPISARPESRRLEALRLAARERVWRFEFTGDSCAASVTERWRFSSTSCSLPSSAASRSSASTRCSRAWRRLPGTPRRAGCARRGAHDACARR